MGRERRRTLFFESKSKKLASIVTFKNPSAARGAVKELGREFNGAKTDDKRLRVFRATLLAANRALASSKRKNLSSRERNELKQISGIYRKAAKAFQKKLM